MNYLKISNSSNQKWYSLIFFHKKDLEILRNFLNYNPQFSTYFHGLTDHKMSKFKCLGQLKSSFLILHLMMLKFYF